MSGNLFSMLHAVGEIYEDRGKTQKQKKSQAHIMFFEGRGMMSCIAYRGGGKTASTDGLARAGRIGYSFQQVWDSSPFRHFPPSGFLHVLTCPIWEKVILR